MNSVESSEKISKSKLWTGRILSLIPALFIIFDSIPKILQVEQVVIGTVQLGYPEHLVPFIGVILLICVVLYIVPVTKLIGAILLTGYLGGAVATHMRVESPLFSHILFPVYLAIVLWGGLYLREESLKNIIPLWRTK